ncbi:MAG TPA: DUF4159 domain-containing protein [Candidatus Kapabacteria bacterium]|nr:DUF4159 domain-containing protein [Candidatus Kapabacteria bacterium]
MRKFLPIAVFMCIALTSFAQTRTVNRSASVFKIARLKYEGGSDWYNGQTEEPNLLKYVAAHTNIQTDPEYLWVDIASDDIFNYPFLFMTGHGNVEFSESEAKRLRAYLDAGGFLYIDDDYGLDKPVRREIKKVFPDQEFKELPFTHEIYHSHFDFPNGVPKTHEHDGKPPQGFGLFSNGRLCVYYTYESNPSDGWDDPDVHDDPPDKREEALKFGTNLVVYALTH